ncbi:biotin--[acetyl-CoA-carboxylase] ligase [Desulforhopalus singaporensis]|uniref:BirA family transcriptional regulator, biotin operon repressor / biotin-[acetyl-CoA-carboxylase] ligase n=1 Tax=Desulforhopalus singaporensis TaxID=91360 RepID=A0A1H0JTW5_9BACT|nr:biotin--[acetyl-CoA-carboxylase] ligase [Desulforhopalus singaporensis]SDO46851.1 BirA family transcriptional regulator, biotin operon repressor / biotin-[acetyl-CoA-carboxylase] ligase [Desulforhopalus singaporensis]
MVPFLFVPKSPDKKMKIYWYDQLDSTNRKAKELAEKGCESGVAVCAKAQTAGRGRLGKQWHSTAGQGLYCSCIVRPTVGAEEYPKLTMVAGVAVARLLSLMVDKKVQLKWPNDVFFDGRKCAGILAESSDLTAPPEKRYAVIGIGINVNQKTGSFPAELQQKVTSLHELAGVTFDLRLLGEKVVQALAQEIDIFEQQGFGPVLDQWRRMDYLLGKNLTCVDVYGELVSGLSLGPDETGNLYLRGEDGRLHKVLSGDVELARKA